MPGPKYIPLLFNIYIVYRRLRWVFFLCKFSFQALLNSLLIFVIEFFYFFSVGDICYLQSIHFDDYLRKFWEDDNLIMYPDFLMNNLALLASEILLNQFSSLSEDYKKVAFKIIRIPIEYSLYNKGHRMDVVFKSFCQFVDKQILLDLLEPVGCKLLNNYIIVVTYIYILVK